jgi:hypothetical protein
MRAMILLLPLAVAFAGEILPLDKATLLWSSDSAEDRDAGSHFVAIHLRRDLAPLLKALEDNDPEVRRRARTAIESLLPPGPPQPPMPQEAAQQQAGQVVFLNGANGQLQGQIIVNARGRLVIAQDGGEMQQLQEKGINGIPADDPLLRQHLRLAEGRGFIIHTVQPRSDADRLGLRAFDILLSIDGRPVKQPGEVLKALAARAPSITLLREGKIVKAGVVEGEGAPGEGK